MTTLAPIHTLPNEQRALVWVANWGEWLIATRYDHPDETVWYDADHSLIDDPDFEPTHWVALPERPVDGASLSWDTPR